MVIVLVGATSGLGRHAARRLATPGRRLFFIGRNPERGEKLARELGPSATFIAGDVSTAAGVDQVADRIKSEVDRVDALINNAGVMVPTRQVTSEGIELNFAVHHLAPFSLTSRLFPLLRHGGRVVNTNSEGHRAPLRGTRPVLLDFADLQSEREYDPFLVYSRTKLANLLFSYELHRRHPELTVAALHPGMVRTDLGRSWPRLQTALLGLVSLSASQGATPLVRLATDPDIENGRYYNRFTAVQSSAASRDTGTATRLWEFTEELRGGFAPA